MKQLCLLKHAAHTQSSTLPHVQHGNFHHLSSFQQPVLILSTPFSLSINLFAIIHCPCQCSLPPVPSPLCSFPLVPSLLLDVPHTLILMTKLC